MELHGILDIAQRNLYIDLPERVFTMSFHCASS